MNFFVYFFSAFSIVFFLTDAVTFKGKVVNAEDSRILLNSKLYYVNEDGSFELSLSSGEYYSMEVYSQRKRFHRLRIEVSEKGVIQVFPIIPGVEWDGKQTSLPYPPLNIEPFAFYDFEPKPESVSILGLLSNPMVITMIIPLCLLYVTPKLIEKIDPEEMKEAQEMLKKARTSNNK